MPASKQQRAAAARKAKAGKRLTEAEVDQIIELKLNRVPVAKIAEQVGCAPNSVQLHWKQWLKATHEERRAELEQSRAAQLAYLESVATLARRAGVRAIADKDIGPEERYKAAARFLAEERQAIRALCTIAGFDAPTQVGVTFDTMTEDEAAAILAAL